MKKCIIYLLVASLLCATVLTGCVDASLLGSLPSTAPGTTGTEAANPTQTKPKPTETQPNPTQTKPKPTETQPNPTQTKPTEPPVTGPVLMDFICKVYPNDDDCRNYFQGVDKTWILNSEDDRAAISELQAELAPYEWYFFDTHFLIVVKIYDVFHPDTKYQTTQVQQMKDGSIYVEAEMLVRKDAVVEALSLRYCRYLFIEVEGTCAESAQVTVNLTTVLVDPPKD